MTSSNDEWLSQHIPPSHTHFQTFPPTSPFIAMGWLEQWRRSKLTRVWKKVLVSLEKNGVGVSTTTMCRIQRQVSPHTTMEVLHQCSIQSIQHVEIVNDDRFILHLGREDTIVLKCPPSAVRNWVSTLRLVGQLSVQTTTVINHNASSSQQPLEDINLISFEQDATTHSGVSHRSQQQQQQPLPQHLHPLQQVPPVSVNHQHPPPPWHPLHPHQQHLHHPQQYLYPHQPRSYAPPPLVPTWNHHHRPNAMMSPPHLHRPPVQPGMNPSPPPPIKTVPPPFPAQTPLQRAPASQPVRSHPIAKPPPTLHRSSSAPPERKTPAFSSQQPSSPPSSLPKYQPKQVTASTPTQTQIQQRVMMEWALRPPAYQCLRKVTLLIPSLHQNLALVPHHDYFRKWKTMTMATTTQDWDKRMRHVRFFLHPDKFPRDFSPDQAYLLRLLWNVMNDAWEEYKKMLHHDDDTEE